MRAFELNENSIDTDYYMEEGCGIWAVAHALKNNGKVLTLYNPEGEVWDNQEHEITHIVSIINGKAHDAQGNYNHISELDDRFGELRMGEFYEPNKFLKKFMGDGNNKPLYGNSTDVKELIDGKGVMRAVDLYEDTEIDRWLYQIVNGTWKRNPDGTINVQGNVLIPERAKILPVQFGYVSGSFNCSNTDIISLNGSPKKIHGDFHCYDTNITSLKGSPLEVRGSFSCSYTKINSLEGIPHEIGGTFSCYHTNITSLKGIPKKVGNSFYCYDTKITDPYEYRYALLSVIDRTFNSKIRKVDEIINTYRWDGNNTPESKRKVPVGIMKLKELSNARS